VLAEMALLLFLTEYMHWLANKLDPRRYIFSPRALFFILFYFIFLPTMSSVQLGTVITVTFLVAANAKWRYVVVHQMGRFLFLIEAGVRKMFG